MTFISLFLFLKKEDSGLLDMLINRQHAKEIKSFMQSFHIEH